MVLQNRLAAGATLVPLALAVGAETAAADPPGSNFDRGGRPLSLEPVPQSPVKGGMRMMQTVPSGRSYRCNEAGTLRRAGGSYVIGWCMEGMHIDISGAGNGAWQPGWAHGNYEHCGWFETLAHPLTPSGVYDHNCGNRRYPETHFASRLNDERYPNHVQALKTCTLYGNVRPWDTSNRTGYNPVGTLPQGAWFHWRYKSRNGKWILGRVDAGGYYDWAFVDSSCVPEPRTRAPQNDM
jgi:hypothetical protein